jgi:hypothetical protein
VEKLDRGTRIYMQILIALTLGLLVLFLYEDPAVSRLNEQLAQDSELNSFPYRFRVQQIKGSTAIMSTPRSAAVPVARVLGILYPHLAGKSPDHPGFQKAQLDLAHHQKKAKKIALSDEEIASVRWELDREWLSRHGIQPQ